MYSMNVTYHCMLLLYSVLAVLFTIINLKLKTKIYSFESLLAISTISFRYSTISFLTLSLARILMLSLARLGLPHASRECFRLL